jgi:hypothetical protein
MPRTLIIYHPDRNLGAEVTVLGDETAPVAVKLQPAGVVIGRFLDAEGRPIANAGILMRYPSQGLRYIQLRLQPDRPPFMTDKDGRFRLEGVVPGTTFQIGPVSVGKALLSVKGRGGVRQVAPGETLDLGDLRAEPRPP